MIIVVDGSNILRAIVHKGFMSDQDRAWLLNIFAQYARKTKHHVHVVFDGGNFNFPTKEERSKLVSVVYSGQRETADDYIKEYLEVNRQKELILVSNDRELRDAAASYDKISVGAMHFFNLIKEKIGKKAEVLRRDQPAKKRAGVKENQELDALMQEGADMLSGPKVEYEKEPKERKSYGYKPSKKERKRRGKLKKL